MNNIQLLDCTLRDGGYVNDWNFGKTTMRSLIHGLVDSNVDILELGFLRDCDYDENKSLFNNLSEAKRLIPANLSNTKVTLMVLHDKYNLDKLEDNDGSIYAIRITFHNYDVKEGLAYAERLMSKGYNVFLNPINIMGYEDSEILELIEYANKIHPLGFAIVDTFGSMRLTDLRRITSLCDHNLLSDITLGLHLHDNMSLAFSLAQKFLDIRTSKRNVIIDASLYGMGRIPGNLCLELIMDYINEHQDAKRYKISSVLDSIDNHIATIKVNYPWGYSPEYFLSAKYNLHRNYAEYFVMKGKLNTQTIDKLLSVIPPEKKSTFDEAYADGIYIEYLNKEIDDHVVLSRLEQEVKGKSVLLLAPGANLIDQKDRIEQYIRERKPYIMSVNFVTDLVECDRWFFTNEKRMVVFWDGSDKEKYLLTSNIQRSDVDMVNYNELSNFPIQSAVSTPILLNLLYRLGVKDVALAGFDGFANDSSNFFDSALSLSGSTRRIYDDNEHMHQAISIMRSKLNIVFVTDSLYEVTQNAN